MSHLVRSYSKSAGLSLTHILTSVDVKFISIVSGSLEDSGLFRPANILQIVDVVRRVVFLLFLLVFRQHFAVKRVTCFADCLPFCYHHQNSSVTVQ